MVRMLPIVMGSFPAPPGFSIKLFEDARIAPNARPLKQDVVGDVGNALWVLMGSIAMVPADRLRQRGEPAAGAN